MDFLPFGLNSDILSAIQRFLREMERTINSDEETEEVEDNRGDDFIEVEVEGNVEENVTTQSSSGGGKGDLPSTVQELVISIPTADITRTKRSRNRWTRTKREGSEPQTGNDNSTDVSDRHRWRSRSPVVLRERGHSH